MKSLIILLLCSLASCDDVKNYDGYTVFRLIPSNLKQIQFLRELAESNFKLDFWTEPNAINSSCDVMVSPQDKSHFESQLKANQINSRTLIPNVQSTIIQEKIAFRRGRPKDYYDDYFSKYQPLDKVEEFIKKIASENSDIASIEVIGKSYEKRDQTVLKLGNPNAKLALWLDSTIHAREWITTATSAWIVKELVEGYKKGDQEIVQLLKDFQLYFLLVFNVDGYQYTHTNDRMWRKTRSVNSGSSCKGTDPNRNFDSAWGTTGISKNPCSETYCGSKPFSEVETKNVADYILKIKDRLKVYISLHSYSQLWMVPYGYSNSKRPANYNDLMKKSQIGADALKAVYGTKYKIGAPPDVIYAASGGAFDWAYDGAGIKQSYTLELRDTGYYGFTLPTSYIQPSGIETWAGLKTMIRSIIQDLGL